MSSGQEAAARAKVGSMAVPLEGVQPEQAVMGVMRLASGQLVACTAEVAALPDKDLWEDTAVGPQPSRWVRLQRSLMGDVVKYARAASDMGVNQRQIKLAEEQTAMIGDLLKKVMGDLNLTAAQRKKVGPAIRRNLQLVEGKAMEKVDA